MRNYFILIIIAGSFLGAAGCTVYGGAVGTRPADVVYVQPAASGPGFVWISGDWFWSGRRYVWHEGHWVRPRARRTWVSGQWVSANRGWRWNRGHWR